MDALDSNICVENPQDPVMSQWLDALPFYYRYACAEQSLQTTKQKKARSCEILQEYASHIHGSPDLSLRMTDDEKYHITCQLCRRKNCMVRNPEEGTVCCEECGFSERDKSDVKFEQAIPYEDQAIRRRRKPYKYNPAAYLKKCLNQVQGIPSGIFSLEFKRRFRQESIRFQVPPDQLTPDLVREILKRLDYSKYYGNRWALLKAVHPKYELVSISHELMERLLCLFSGASKRYARHKSRLGHNRKNFLSYRIFARQALHRLGYHATAEEFSPLKTNYRDRLHQDLIETVLDEFVPQKPSAALSLPNTDQEFAVTERVSGTRKRKRKEMDPETIICELNSKDKRRRI